jgi:DNA polymerase V
MKIDLTNPQILNTRHPNKKLKEIIFNAEFEDSGIELPGNAKKLLLNYPFQSVSEMVEKLALYSAVPSEQVTEELFESIFDPNRSNVILPKYSSKVSCGFVSPADDYKEGFLSLNAKFIKNPASTFPVEAEGDCMRETIFSGDILLVDNSLEAKNGDIVLATLDGEFTMKRLEIRKNQISLQPDNPVYNPIHITEEMNFEIRGVVTSIHRNLR